MQGLRDMWDDLPIVFQYAVIGAAVFGITGGIAGLVIGLDAYAPTAWFATLELGVPAAMVGGVAGYLLGLVSDKKHD